MTQLITDLIDSLKLVFEVVIVKDENAISLNELCKNSGDLHRKREQILNDKIS